MKRPLGCACLLFILFIRVFYTLFPPLLPDYSAWKGRTVYVNGQVVSIKEQEINGEIQTVYLLEGVSLEKSSTVQTSYLSDKNNSVSNTKDNSGTTYVHDKIYCYSNISNSQIPIGSRVWVKGSFQPYESAQNPGQFDSKFYYHIQDIGGGIWDAEVIWCNQEKTLFSQSLYNFKQYFLQKINTYFSPKYAGVMKTILLGDKADLDHALKDLFREGGILHILTISGLHISMLGMGCFNMLRRLKVPVKSAAVAGLLLVVMYGAMIGTQAATFRAICMFAMQMSALLLGRTYDRLTGLSVAAMLLLLEQPLYVFYSGFLLSFGAVLGVTVIAPLVEKLCKDKVTIVKWFGKLFSGGIGILAATFPIQLYFYYEYPIYSMLINIMVLPCLPYIVGFGAIVLATPGDVSVVALPFVYVCQGLLWGYEQICLQSQKLPYHCLVLGAPAGWQIVLYYVCLFLWGYLLLHGKKKWVSLLVCGAMMAAVVILMIRPVFGLTCRFLSVGQGDCTVLQYGQETYVVDCGSTSESKVADNILLPCLKYYGISEVDGVFISHADGDHMNGILQWLTTYEHSHVKIGRIVLPSLGKEALEQEFGELLRSAETLDIPVTTLGAGDSLQIGELGLEVLHPVKYCKDVEDANGYSQVLLFTYQGHGILLTGDIGAEQEMALLEKLSEVQERTQYNVQKSSKDAKLNALNTGWNIAVLKAAHHGSKYSNSSEFLQAAMPEHIILSYGVGNSYGHPHADAVARMKEINAELWYTGRHGAIMVEINGEIEVRSWGDPTGGGK